MAKIKRYSLGKLVFLRILCIFVNIAPLIVLLIINWGVYTKTRSESIALSVTGFVWLVFLIMSAFSSFSPKLARPIKLLCFFIILELIDPLILSLKWFVLCSFIGAGLDFIIIQPLIKQMLELRVATKTTDLTKEAVREILREEGGGRV